MSGNNSVLEQCHILQLNDDCFFEIYKHLPVIDCLSLRETCTRLQLISDICFGRQYKSLELREIVFGTDIELLTMTYVRRFIRNFGCFITNLTVNYSSFVPREDYIKLIPLLDRYCIGLRKLKLVKISFDSNVVEQCHRLLSNLHGIVIDRCIYDENTFTTFLSNCSSLKELENLTGFGVNIDGHGLANNFKTLESFTIDSCYCFQYIYIREFLVQNSQLKKLKICVSHFTTDCTELYRDICYYLPNLEELSVYFVSHKIYDANEVSLVRLEKLKKLEINNNEVADINALLIPLAAHKNIENLNIASIRMNDQITQTICELETLKILKLTLVDELNRDVYKKLASELPSLVEIHIIDCLHTTFSDLSEFVEHSTNLKIIVFKRAYWDRTLFTLDMFSSLIKVLQRKQTKETLKVHLNDNDLSNIKNEFELQGHPIKLLLAEEESITATVLPSWSSFE